MNNQIEFTTSIEINSNPEKVWDIFTDTKNYKYWNPFIKKIWGKYELNNFFLEFGYVGKNFYLPFPMKVIEFKKNLNLTYHGRLPGFFGYHNYSLEKIHESKSKFSHNAKFSGIFVKLMKNHFQTDIKKIHIEMNEALKKIAEK